MTDQPKKYNLEALHDLSAGDDAFYEDMIRTFLRTTKQTLDAMHQASNAQQWIRVGDLAHKMRGPCTHLGTTVLSMLLEQIETDITDHGRTEHIPKLVEQAVEEGAAVFMQLSNDTGLQA
jgi:HPt (histidine-containing phosphotransfer) domain-containing protein